MAKRIATVPASEAIRLQPPSAFESAEAYFPARQTLPALRKAAAECRACDLWRSGRQTVFGEGDRHATLVLIGEQPGDQEDRAGRPFVGPSGHLLDEALEAAGIDRATTYVTNAVKHFKWKRATSVRRIPPRKATEGERRIHQTPTRAEEHACRPWLDAELRLLQPKVVLCLGATAAQAILGRGFRVTRHRGTRITPPDDFTALFGETTPPQLFATVHPSAVLRAPTAAARAEAQEQFFADVARVARALNA